MTVEEKLQEYAKSLAGDLTLERVTIGVGYTGVKLSNGNGGAAYTFRNDLGHSCGVMPKPGSLKGTPAVEALDWLTGNNLAARAVAMATANALMNQGYEPGPELSAAVDCKEDDVVGMIGWFCPLVKKYQGAKEFYIFEKNLNGIKEGGIEKILPSEEAFNILPKCNKVVLTATSFINGTADGLLAACKEGAEVTVVGASTPMCMDVLKDYGVTVLAGVEVTDADMLCTILAEGGGGMDMKPATIKLLETSK